DLVDQGDDVTAGDAVDRALAPARDERASDHLLDRARAALGADVPGDERLGHGGEGAGIGGAGGARLLGPAHARVDAILDLAQDLARPRPRLGERGERV